MLESPVNISGMIQYCLQNNTQNLGTHPYSHPPLRKEDAKRATEIPPMEQLGVCLNMTNILEEVGIIGRQRGGRNKRESRLVNSRTDRPPESERKNSLTQFWFWFCLFGWLVGNHRIRGLIKRNSLLFARELSKYLATLWWSVCVLGWARELILCGDGLMTSGVEEVLQFTVELINTNGRICHLSLFNDWSMHFTKQPSLELELYHSEIDF